MNLVDFLSRFTIPSFVVQFLVSLFAAFGLALNVGCNVFDPVPAGDRMINEIVIPTAQTVTQKLSEQGFRSGEFAGDVRVDDPTYELDVEGYWVTGVLIRTRAGLDGINGAAELRAVSDEEVETSPFNRDRQDPNFPN